MKQLFRYACTTSFVAAAIAVMPVWGQLGLGGVTGGVTSSVGGTVGATSGAVSGAGGVGGAANGAVGRQDVFGSLSATQDAALSSQLSSLLPPSYPVSTAAAGFQNDIEFITALHAAHNLGIPFEQLKAETTGKNSMALNAALRKLRPDLDAGAVKDSVSLAKKQSERDIARASSAGSKDKVASRVMADSSLSAQAAALVPKGQSVGDAAAGFRNEQQFFSTLHAANDNGIAFADLKDRVTAGQSLSTAIREMRPSMGADASASAAASAEAKGKSAKVATN